VDEGIALCVWTTMVPLSRRKVDVHAAKLLGWPTLRVGSKPQHTPKMRKAAPCGGRAALVNNPSQA
jgi:hypothetical protein